MKAFAELYGGVEIFADNLTDLRNHIMEKRLGMELFYSHGGDESDLVIVSIQENFEDPIIQFALDKKHAMFLASALKSMAKQM